jgi:hypothetical protein
MVGDIDGVYGPHSSAVVQTFPARSGPVADGEVSRQTLKGRKL